MEEKSRKLIWIPIVAIFILVFVIGFIISARIFTPEDNWICENGAWVAHGNPKSEKPKLECRVVKKEEKTNKENKPAGNIVTENSQNINDAINKAKNIDPVAETHNAVNAIPNENPVGPAQISGFLAFMAPVVDIAGDLGWKVCELGRPKDMANMCPSVKAQYQEIFNKISR